MIRRMTLHRYRWDGVAIEFAWLRKHCRRTARQPLSESNWYARAR